MWKSLLHPYPLLLVSSSFILHPSPLLALSLLVGGPLTSYLLAAALMGAAPWAAAGQKGPYRSEVARRPPARQSSPRPQPEIVARITSMRNCQWADPAPCQEQRRHGGAKIPPVSGQMEIAYKTGARVVLEGPCFYQVDSPSSGFVPGGFVYVRPDVDVEAPRVEGRRSGVSPPGAANPSQIALVLRTRTTTATFLKTARGIQFGGGVRPGLEHYDLTEAEWADWRQSWPMHTAANDPAGADGRGDPWRKRSDGPCPRPSSSRHGRKTGAPASHERGIDPCRNFRPRAAFACSS